MENNAQQYLSSQPQGCFYQLKIKCLSVTKSKGFCYKNDNNNHMLITFTCSACDCLHNKYSLLLLYCNSMPQGTMDVTTTEV